MAVDAERASGYRYCQRAYLVQLRRAGAGTALIDPIALPRPVRADAALADAEWVLHAASQDLPCLRRDRHASRARLFDTELAARLAGFERVGLGAMVENVLGLQPGEGPLRGRLVHPPAARGLAALRRAGRRGARRAARRAGGRAGRAGQAGVGAPGVRRHRRRPAAAPRVDPWRRTSGIHRVRSRRQLAAVARLWQARDAMARRRDIRPGRLLPDAAIVAAVAAAPADPGRAARAAGLRRPGHPAATRDVVRGAARGGQPARGRAAPADCRSATGPPPANRWAERDPVAAARLARVRAVVAEHRRSSCGCRRRTCSARGGAPAGLDPARPGDARDGGRVAHRQRRAALAGRAAGRAAGGRAPGPAARPCARTRPASAPDPDAAPHS